MSSRNDLLVITGPTASGKTALAAEVASRLNGEIISADSRQVYRHMNLGTGKDYDDYLVNGKKVPYHLIDIVDPGHRYNVFEYQRDFINAYSDIIARKKFPVVCGGSGMYLDSVVSGYRLLEVPPDERLRQELEGKPMDELVEMLSAFKRLHNQTDIDSKKRVVRAIEIELFYDKTNPGERYFPDFNSVVIGVAPDRETRRERISSRLAARLDNGMIDEVRQLLESGIDSETLIYYGLEYKFITLYLLGLMTREEMFHDLEIAIHQFAKRQMTWFRGMERKGIKINWIDASLPLDSKVDLVLGFLGR
ncbi:MAG: tRNA (adenosine(37)-N6)-dimethylallyltransferase MiaA [Bacteroidales bacterium]